MTGRPPFEGRTVLEILSKHQTSRSRRPKWWSSGVPKSLSTIILKMVAKKPEDRYADLSEVIAALEGFLGVSSTGPFTPREEHANLLEAVRQRVQRLSRGAAAIDGCAADGRGVLALGVSLPAARVDRSRRAYSHAGALDGARRFRAGRDHAEDAAVPEGLRAGVGSSTLRMAHRRWPRLAILVGLLSCLEVVLDLAGAGLLAIGIAVAIPCRHSTAAAEAERREPLDQVEGMLRSLRLQGLDEDAMRQFVCKYSGAHWEELYEALFGYEAKLEARERWGRGERAKRGRDSRLGATRSRVGSTPRSPRGVKPSETVETPADRGKKPGKPGCKPGDGPAQSPARRRWRWWRRPPKSRNRSALATARSWSIVPSPEAMREAAANPEKVLLEHERGLLPERERGPHTGRACRISLLGPKVRFLAGAALLAGCIAWMHQNAMISAEHAAGLGRGGQEPATSRPSSLKPRQASRVPASEPPRRPSCSICPIVPPVMLRSGLFIRRGRRRVDPDHSRRSFQADPDHVLRHPRRRDPSPAARASGVLPTFGVLDPSLVAERDRARTNGRGRDLRPRPRVNVELPPDASPIDRRRTVGRGVTDQPRAAPWATPEWSIRGRVISSKIVGRPRGS